MDKYALLIILNVPFVVYGILSTFVMFREGAFQRLGLAVRIFFWFTVLFGLFFAEELYTLLFNRNLTDTTPLSLADVILVTGVLLSLTLCIGLYSKVENLEKRISDLHEELSIKSSID